MHIMCVRGNELPEPVFSTQTIAGELVVNDLTTGLMWQKEYKTGKTWQQALKYCEDLTYAGYSDWRLPNKNELVSLLNYDDTGAPYSDFPGMPRNYFWSSSTFINQYYDNNGKDYAWGVNFIYGDVYNISKTNQPYIHCVRNAE